MMETKSLSAYDKKFYVCPDHYFPRFQLALKEPEPEVSIISESDDLEWNYDDPYFRPQNWLEKIIEEYVNKTFLELGLGKDGIMTRKMFLDYIVPVMLKNNVFDGTWSQLDFNNIWASYAHFPIQNHFLNDAAHGCDHRGCIEMVKRIIKYRRYW
jgi:hypothetical protein